MHIHENLKNLKMELTYWVKNEILNQIKLKLRAHKERNNIGLIRWHVGMTNCGYVCKDDMHQLFSGIRSFCRVIVV